MISTIQADEYPLAAFYFAVSFGNNPRDVDCSFCEVSGISPEIELETVEAGGESRFVHQLPVAVKHQNLVLKRGVAPLSSSLVTWCRDALDGGLEAGVAAKRVNVSLMGEQGQMLRTWSFENAFPVKWEAGPIQSTTSEVTLQTVELSYVWAKRGPRM